MILESEGGSGQVVGYTEVIGEVAWSMLNQELSMVRAG